MILNILKELEATSSRLEKEAIILREKNNELLKRVYFLAYDPFTQFYQRKIPAYEQTYKTTFGLEWAFDELKKLSSREVTGNKAIEHLTYILSSLSEDNAKVIERIIGKDLKCGASDSTANKIWPKLIHTYPCMLCTPFDEKLVSKMKFPAYAQMKMDGMRFNAIVREGKVEFRSRNGKEILLLGNLEKEFAALAGKIDCVFDGELLVMDEFDYQFMDRQSGNGILNKANKGTISAKEASMVHASLWDLIPYEEFISGRCVTPYAKRFSSLEIVVSKQKYQDKKIWLVSSEIVQNIEEAQSIFQNYLSLGHEGIILKDGSGVWEDKRVKTQIKFKAELDCDLRIIDIQPGTGKYTGMVGAYICESEDGIVKVDVGSGLTDEERTNFDVIGKIATVLYNARIKNKQGEESLFLPRLVEIREDKDKADSSKKIK